MLKLKRPRAIFLVPLILAFAYFSYGRWENRTPYRSHAFASTIVAGEREYAVVLPKGYSSGGEAWPAILYLHGLGEVGDDLTTLLERGLLKELHDGLEIPFIVIAPQAMYTDHYQDGWKRNEGDILKVLADAQQRYRIDPDRIYLTGISMGGIGSFYMASQHPQLFAAVAPIAGEGNTAWVAEYHGLPFWVFHGVKDEVISIDGAQAMVDRMKADSIDVQFTSYPEAHHDSWTSTYRNPELFRWFLTHRRDSAGQEQELPSAATMGSAEGAGDSEVAPSTLTDVGQSPEFAQDRSRS